MALVIPMKVSTYMADYFTSTGVINGVTGRIPSNKTKSGYRHITFCGYDFTQFFSLPTNAKNVQMHLTKSPSSDGQSYKMGSERVTEITPSGRTYHRIGRTLGGFIMPGLLGTGNSSFDYMVSLGYKHVRFTYE